MFATSAVASTVRKCRWAIWVPSSRFRASKSLPQITVTGAFTLGQAIAGNVFGSNYYGLREIVQPDHADVIL